LDVVLGWITYGDMLRRAWDTSFLLIIILLLRKIAGKRLLPSYRRILWGICFLRIIFPLQLAVFHSLYEYVGVSQLYENIECRISDISIESFGRWYMAEISNDTFAALFKLKWICFDFLDQLLDKYTLQNILVFLWFMGVIVVFTIFTLKNIFFYRRMKKQSYLYGIRDNLPVYITDEKGGSCLFGIVNPEIYVGHTALEHETWRSLIVSHELTHYRAGDNLYRMFINICVVFMWFNPLVWYCVKISGYDCELACDDRMLRNMNCDLQVEYGKCLIAMAGHNRKHIAVASHLNNTILKKRIRYIADYKAPDKSDIMFGNVVVIFIAVLFSLCILS